MEIKFNRMSRRESIIFEKKSDTFLLKDNIMINNIKLYEEQYGKSNHKWGKLLREDINIRKRREKWISHIIQITDEFDFSFDTCEIAIQFMDIFFEMKMENTKDVLKYESFFLRDDISKWIDQPLELAYLFSVIISLSCKFQEQQKDSNIIIKGVDKKKMAKYEYEMMDYFNYIVPYKTPSFFLYLLVDDFFNSDKIIFYTYRMIEDCFKYSHYVIEKHTLLSFSILKCVLQDIFKQGFLLRLWEEKVKKYISNIDERIQIDKIYDKIKYFILKTEGYVEHLDSEYKTYQLSFIMNKKPLYQEEEEEEVFVIHNPILSINYQYRTPKIFRLRLFVKIGTPLIDEDWELPNPPIKKVKISEE